MGQNRGPNLQLTVTPDAGVMRWKPSIDSDVHSINLDAVERQLKSSGHLFGQSNLKEWRIRRGVVLEGLYQDSPMTGKAENR
uniref:Uncharacterized protein n=1 Tax=Trichogramma kaykai TaxID=54128 RepID=A0ABD2WGC8_9HYME